MQEYLVAERSKFLSLSLPLPPDTASVSWVGDNAIFLGFPRIFHAGAIGTEEMRGHEKRESGKMQRGEEGKGGRHVERRQQRGARFTRCPRGTHWFQMFPTSHLYLPLSYNRANIENVPWN